MFDSVDVKVTREIISEKLTEFRVVKSQALQALSVPKSHIDIYYLVTRFL